MAFSSIIAFSFAMRKHPLYLDNFREREYILNMLTLDTVYQASFTLKEACRVTDLIRAPRMFPDKEVYLKTENLQTTGSFKLRGAYYKISKLSDEQKKKGVIACSAGNHAQGVALAAQRQGAR